MNHEKELELWQECYQNATDEAFAANQRVVELEQEIADVNNSLFGSQTSRILGAAKMIEDMKHRNGELWRETTKLKKYLEKVYSHIAFEQEVPEGFYDWFDDNGKAL